MESKKIFIQTDICSKRRLDAKRISKYLKENNHKIVNNPKDADIIILSTCAFNDERTEYSLEQVKKYKKYKSELIVAGCLPDIEKEELKKIFNGKIITPTTIDEIDNYFPENETKINKINDQNILWENKNQENIYEHIKKIVSKLNIIEKNFLLLKKNILKILLEENSEIYRSFIKKQYYLRISWGCPNNCSYCAIKKAIGPLKSKGLEACIQEFKNGLSQNYKYFVIEADDVGAYGLDIKKSFPDLLDRITEIPGDYIISIRDLNPRWVMKYEDKIEQILKKRKIKHLFLPIQSGNSRILKLMNRYYDKEKIKEIILRYKNTDKDLRIATHLIVGFPSETEEEFIDSLKFIKEVGFDEGLLFPFSSKKGTKAEDMNPKISNDIISKRMKFAQKFFKRNGYNAFYHKSHFLFPQHFIFNKK
jgi:MiaB/RimO family radical SAM methylthiotransferase